MAKYIKKARKKSTVNAKPVSGLGIEAEIAEGDWSG